MSEKVQNTDIIQTFIQQGSKQETSSRLGLPNNIVKLAKKEVIVDGRDAHTPYNRIYSIELSPSLENLCVQETETAELAQHHTTAHIEVSHIANSDDETTGFERSEVAGACDILESGGEVSKPSHLQIKYTANQDFGTNPSDNSTKELNQSQTKPKLRRHK